VLITLIVFLETIGLPGISDSLFSLWHYLLSGSWNIRIAMTTGHTRLTQWTEKINKDELTESIW